MVLGIVADGQDTAVRFGTGFPKDFQELPEGLSVESPGFAAVQKLAVPQTYGGKVADALARRVMIDDRVADLRRNPHATARSLLLEVNFVQSKDQPRRSPSIFE